MIGPDLVLHPGVKVTLKEQTDQEYDFGMDELSLHDITEPEQVDGRVLLGVFKFRTPLRVHFKDCLGKH